MNAPPFGRQTAGGNFRNWPGVPGGFSFPLELDRLRAASHPLIELFLIEPPISADSKGWDLTLPKKLVNRGRMDCQPLP